MSAASNFNLLWSMFIKQDKQNNQQHKIKLRDQGIKKSRTRRDSFNCINCSSVLDLKPHVVEHEGPFVGLLVDDHAGGFTCTVARFGIDADDHRSGTSMPCL